MGTMCTGADFDCGRCEEDLDRAARGEAEEVSEIAANIRQSALTGEGRRKTDMTPRECGSGEQEGAKTKRTRVTSDGPNPNKAPREKATEGTQSCAEAHQGQANSGSWQVQRSGEQSSSASGGGLRDKPQARGTSPETQRKTHAACGNSRTRGRMRCQEQKDRRRQRSWHQPQNMSGGSSVTGKQACICPEVRLQISTMLRALRRWWTAASVATLPARDAYAEGVWMRLAVGPPDTGWVVNVLTAQGGHVMSMVRQLGVHHGLRAVQARPVGVLGKKERHPAP